VKNISELKFLGVPIALWFFPPFALLVLTVNVINAAKSRTNKDKKDG
jgi:hypothetical protein|tara:strand:- start:274 stop:414 length:141 start_codon:yes stop_codon:yes gene_type:complete